MVRNRWILVLIGVMVVVLAGCGGTSSAASGSPEATVTEFYAWYLGFEGTPLGSGAYRDSAYLSERMIAEIDETVVGFDGRGGGDPLICAQDRPPEITILDVAATAEQARITVQGWNPIYVDVTLTDGAWQINDIHCTPPEG